MLDRNENAPLPIRRIFLVAVAIVAAVGFSGQKAEQRRAALDGGVSEVAHLESPSDGVWATDGLTEPDAGPSLVVAIPMPTSPLKGQKLKPCDTYEETELFGACWEKLGRVPVPVKGKEGKTCGRNAFEYDGGCYKAIPLPKSAPSSVMP